MAKPLPRSSAVQAGRAPDGTAFDLIEGRGGGAPVVLIHGVGLDREMWAPQVAALTALGPVLSYDMIGHGETPPRPDGCALGDFAAQLAALLDALGIERCRPVGFSMGGIVARAFAARWPERVERLVLMSTVFERTAAARASVEGRCETVAAEGIAATVGPALERWFTPAWAAAHPDVVEAVRRRMLANDPAGYLAAYRVFATADREPAAEGLARIACPTLVLTGADDANSTPAMAETLAKRLSDGRALVLPGRRHMMPLEAADEVNAALLDFLA